MQEFLDFVVKGLVRQPEAVSITPVERHGETVFQLRLHASDMGRVIGKDGAMINSLRSLLLAGSAKKGVRCSLEVIEEKPASQP
jgi:predicted RNA-binding protein YlqC (UPF0109 family)